MNLSYFWTSLRLISQGNLQTNLSNIMKDCSSIADLGCGSRSTVKMCIQNKRLIAIDAWFPVCNVIKSQPIVSSVCQAIIPPIPLRSSSVDAVVILQVLEHLTKDQGYQLLNDAGRVARRKIVITTPNGFVGQGSYGCNPYQQHICGWSPQEFENLGYSVIGYDGLKLLRKPFSPAMIFPSKFWEILVSFGLFEKYVFDKPRHGFQLLAYKNIDKDYLPVI
jgi:hypothetical protein